MVVPRTLLMALAAGAIGSAIGAPAGEALAEPETARQPEPETARQPATDLVTEALRPERGELRLALGYEADLSHNRGGSRALAPDVSYGITDDVSVSIAHSARSIARIGSPAGWCVELCDYRPEYTGNLLAAYALVKRDGLQLYGQGGFLVRDTDPWKPAAMLGAAGRWQRGRFAVDAAPYLQLGLANTDKGNRHRLVVPVRAWVQPTCRWSLGLHSGVEGELEVFSDAYHVPFAGLVTAAATSRLYVSVEVGFSSLGGPLNTASRRYASLALELRL